MLYEYLKAMLGGLSPVLFAASYTYFLAGLIMNLLKSYSIRLLKEIGGHYVAPRERKLRRRLFAVRAAMSFIAGFLIITLCSLILGKPLNNWIAVGTGLVVEIAIEFLFSFAATIFPFLNNQNTVTMPDNLISDDVFLIENDTDMLLEHGVSLAEYAQQTGGTFLPVEGEPETIDGTERKFELRYTQGAAPVETLELQRIEPVNDETMYFVGHVPRPPRKPTT